MAQTILLKRRTADATAPTASDLTTGEVAVNAYSGKLYIKKTDGTVTEVSGSGGGGSSFPAVYNTYKYTATNGQTTFSGNDSSSNFLTYNVGNLIVFLNGVLLVPTTDYVATTGNTVVLQDGATTNDILTIVAFTATIGDGNVAVDTFSGDGSTTAFTLAANPQNENNTQVFIDGIYQSKSNYSVSGTTLTFSTAPPNNTSIEVTTGSREVTQYTATTLSLPNAGMSITGGDLDIPSDSRKIKLGASNDLQIFHDGTNNYIQGGTGDLRIDAKSGERGIVVTPDGATTLYHDNAAKIATASGGVTITGTATATTFVGDVTGDVTGNVTGNVSGTSGSTTGNAATATALANARTIGGTSFDGTANIVPATAVSVTGAAQSAITSVGTLTGLTMSGAVDMGNQLITNVGASITFSTSVDGTINFPSTGRINFDSDDNSAGEDFIIGSNRTGGSGGNEHLRITAAGNVGIGINPPNTFSVGASGTVTTRYTSTDTSAFSLLMFENSGSIVFSADHGNGAANSDIVFKADGATEKMRIASTGIVTINPNAGATTGTLRLHNANGNGTLGQIDFGHSGSVHHGSIGYTGNMDFYTGGSDTSKLQIDSVGTIKVGAGVPAASWDANLDAIQVGEASAFRSGDTDYSAATVMSTNLYQTGGGDKLLNSTDLATQYTQQGGNHYFYGYDNGTAGDTPTVTSGDLANPLVIAKGGGLSIGGGTVGNTANGKAGIFWHSVADGADYCIRRTNHTWAGSNYAQLLLDWETGVKIDAGAGTYGKSYLEVNGNVKFTASGQGLDFSNANDTALYETVSSSVLDDYEEGTFTFHIDATGTAPTITEGNTGTGQYTKIGNMVTVRGYTGTRTITNIGTGIARINQLPFANASGYYSVVSMTHGTMFGSIQSGYVESNQRFFYPIVVGGTNGTNYTTGTHYIMFTVTYMTA